MTLTLTGMCIGVPPVREGQHFITSVRTRDTKNLSISNRSNQQWNLKPIIDGEQWSGPVSFIVEPLQTKQYELTYYPLTMTSEGKKHQVGSYISTLSPLGNFSCFLSSDFFQNQLFQKNLSGIPSECQTVWTQIRPDKIQSVCKGCEQTTLLGIELREPICKLLSGIPSECQTDWIQIWVQSVCKGYKQRTLLSIELGEPICNND